MRSTMMMLAAGTRVGVYEVVGPAETAGQGESYLALDTQQRREVLLYALAPAVAADPEQCARLRAEVELLATLSHPNLAAAHGLEPAGGTYFLVLEPPAGPTLAELMAKGRVSVGEALDLCRQIAAGLEYAHQHGVVHRLLNPATIRVDSEARVKILECGLSKNLQAAAGFLDSATVAMDPDATRLGSATETTSYMSPEQVRGQAPDARSDTWAFGCILYELLAGRKAFGGKTLAQVLMATMSRPPSWDALPAGTPARIGHLLLRCLEKNSASRLQDIGEARAALEEVLGIRR